MPLLFYPKKSLLHSIEMTSAFLLTTIHFAIFHLAAGQSVNQETSEHWLSQGKATLSERVKYHRDMNSVLAKHKAKGVILFIGDGMGAPAVEKLGSEQTPLSWEHFPHAAMVKTYNMDRHTADSASTATAFLTGTKAHWYTVGVGAAVKHDQCEGDTALYRDIVDTLATLALKQDYNTGMVTNTRVTHATPASLYAHAQDRDWESDVDMLQSDTWKKCGYDKDKHIDIARQMVEKAPGMHMKVIFGGGWAKFKPNITTASGSAEAGIANAGGIRADGLDLTEEWKSATGGIYMETLDELNSLDTKTSKQVLGLFSSNHLPYALEYKNISAYNQPPTLKDMTIKAIELLENEDKPYFLLVEGGRIDHALHENRAKMALEEVRQLHLAVQTAFMQTDPSKTLIIVTADHSHVMSIIGHPRRNESITGKFYPHAKDYINDGMSTALVFANGPSAILHRTANGRRRNLTSIDTEADDFMYPAFMPAIYETHGGEDVPLWASGPFSALLSGTIENTFIPKVIGFALCIEGTSEGLTGCDLIGSEQNSGNGPMSKWHVGERECAGILTVLVVLLVLILIFVALLLIINIVGVLRLHRTPQHEPRNGNLDFRTDHYNLNESRYARNNDAHVDDGGQL